MWTLSSDPTFQVPKQRDKGIPRRALGFTAAAAGVPALSAWIAPGWLIEDQGLLLWIVPLLPAFVLAYYAGWRGAALALAAGMSSLATAHVVFMTTGVEPPEWPLMLGVVVIYLLIAGGIASLAELLHRERIDAEGQARTDVLTGLPNRREATSHLDRAFAAALRGGSLAVVVFDLDRFKQLNDREGHAAGDTVLKAFGEILRGETRRMDLSARIGGEEFVSILAPCPVEIAERFAERVRARTEEMDLGFGPITVSAGVAEFQEGLGSPELLVAAADHAMYKAKEMGRNQVQRFQRRWAWPEEEEAAPAQPPAPERAGPTPSRGVRRLRGKRPDAPMAVIVDDDDDVGGLLSDALVQRGYTVFDARDPGHVLDLFDEFGDRIDLLITDVVMPEMNGLTLVSTLARRGHHVRVIYVSGYMQGEVTLPGIPGTASGFVEKPIEIDALDRELARVLSDAGR